MFAILFSVLIVCNPIYFLSHSLQSLFIVFLSVGLSPSLLLSWLVQWSCVPLFVYFPFGLFPSRQSPLFACIPVCLSLYFLAVRPLIHRPLLSVSLCFPTLFLSFALFCLCPPFICHPLWSVAIFCLLPPYVCHPLICCPLLSVSLLSLSPCVFCLSPPFVCHPLLSVAPFCLSLSFVCRPDLSVTLICLSPILSVLY